MSSVRLSSSSKLCARIDALSSCDSCSVEESGFAACGTGGDSGAALGAGVSALDAVSCDTPDADVSARSSVTAASFVTDEASVTQLGISSDVVSGNISVAVSCAVSGAVSGTAFGAVPVAASVSVSSGGTLEVAAVVATTSTGPTT